MSSAVFIQTFSKEELRHAEMLTGVSPTILRRVFVGWMIFALIIAAVVSFAPGLSMSFILTTLAILVVFSIAMFAQSRISEGWPAIILTEHCVGVVCDPQKRQFICVNHNAVQGAEPAKVRPNRRAIAIKVKASAIDDETLTLLRSAVWPRDDRLLGLIFYRTRDDVCQYINNKCGCEEPVGEEKKTG